LRGQRAGRHAATEAGSGTDPMFVSLHRSSVHEDAAAECRPAWRHAPATPNRANANAEAPSPVHRGAARCRGAGARRGRHKVGRGDGAAASAAGMAPGESRRSRRPASDRAAVGSRAGERQAAIYVRGELCRRRPLSRAGLPSARRRLCCCRQRRCSAHCSFTAALTSMRYRVLARIERNCLRSRCRPALEEAGRDRGTGRRKRRRAGAR